MRRSTAWIGLLALALFLAACGGGGGTPPPGQGCDPAKFDSGCTFDSGAKYGMEVGIFQSERS